MANNLCENFNMDLFILNNRLLAMEVNLGTGVSVIPKLIFQKKMSVP